MSDLGYGEDAQSGSEAPAARRASILLVDDNPNNLTALVQMLAPLGQDIVQARSGIEALRALLRQDFAIVLLDVKMPDIDGYELAQLIRGRARTRDTPIIFITAHDQEPANVVRGYALGAVDYVFKPIEPVVLCAKVAVFVQLFRKTEEVREQARFERRLQQENLRVRGEKIEAERALRMVEERQALIVRSLPLALYTADLRDGFAGPRFLSDSIASAVGFPPSTFVEDVNLWCARIHPADLDEVLAQVSRSAETGSLSTEYRWRCADGSERIFLDQAVLVRGDDGSPSGLMGTCLDVTYRKRLEQQLVQSQKLEAIGQLTGGIAHDFNNMIAVVIWNLQAMVRALERGRNRDRAQNALFAALNCAELIRQLLTFARNQPHQAKLLDLAEHVPRVAKLLTPLIGEGIKLRINLAPDLWPVFADPAQVESTLLNLAINARDAMPEGGTLAIEASDVELDRGDPELPPGRYALIAVSDTGIGMPKEVLDRAFEPFFSTKEHGRGTGLGLSMVYGFIKQAGGAVRIESQAGVGTTVRVYLPCRPPSEPAAEPVDAEGLPCAAAGHGVLVVEDDPSVRAITVARMAEYGCNVLEAEHGAAALEILTGDATVDLLFTDMVMPGGMSGLELARRAREIRPGIKVIFASGYAASFESGDALGPVLQKPYSDEDLLSALSDLFDPDEVPPLAAAVGE
jgi:PAS domain S-box-containing protein